MLKTRFLVILIQVTDYLGYLNKKNSFDKHPYFFGITTKTRSNIGFLQPTTKKYKGPVIIVSDFDETELNDSRKIFIFLLHVSLR